MSIIYIYICICIYIYICIYKQMNIIYVYEYTLIVLGFVSQLDENWFCDKQFFVEVTSGKVEI